MNPEVLMIVNKLANGAHIDILLCFFIPWLLERAYRWLEANGYLALNWCRFRKTNTRVVSFDTLISDGRYRNSSDSPSRLICYALQDYLHASQSTWIHKVRSAKLDLDHNAQHINICPPLKQWICISPDIRLYISESTHDVGKARMERTVYKLETHRDSRHIDDFITQAFDTYMDNRNRNRDKKCYMYLPVSQERDGQICCEKYLLKNEKTLDLVFFPDKERVKALVDDFTARRNRFAVRGYPYKLGFLLHGKPGTGKTSFIKALANYTKRSIMNIPLGKIRTNTQLMDLMFANKVVCGHEWEKDVPIAFDQLIYVLEDVDAATDAVKCRRAKPVNQTHEDHKEQSQNFRDDALSLAGILNVIDGIVDTPGRILIMTTNHPEALDPALVRPGRVNACIHLDAMTRDDALKMVSHYLGPPTEDEKAHFMANFPEKQYTPALVESLCLSLDSVRSLLPALSSTTDTM